MDCKKHANRMASQGQRFQRPQPLVRLAQRFAYCPMGQLQLKNGRELLDRLLAVRCAAQDTGPLGERDQFCKRLDLHLLHHPLAMGLDGALSAA